MLDAIVFGCFAAVTAAIALYSFLERSSWMHSQIVASFVSSVLLWVETLLLASGNVGFMKQTLVGTAESYTYNGSMIESIQTVYSYSDVWTTVAEPALVYMFILFAVVMTVYTILHIMVWLQDRATGIEEENDE